MNTEPFPTPGFYYHFKHDPEVLNDHAYEMMGSGRHTEDETFFVVYRPLYENTFQKGADFCLRPLAMWNEHVTRDGYDGPRFAQITDPEIVKKLEEVRDRMYS